MVISDSSESAGRARDSRVGHEEGGGGGGRGVSEGSGQDDEERLSDRDRRPEDQVQDVTGEREANGRMAATEDDDEESSLGPARNQNHTRSLATTTRARTAVTETEAPASTNPPTSHPGSRTNLNQSERVNEVFYVQSASLSSKASSSRPSNRQQHSNPTINYEVRLQAWNCTCPAFALSAFGRILNLGSGGSEGDSGYQHHDEDPREDEPDAAVIDDIAGWRFGGTLTQRSSSHQSPSPGLSRGETTTPVCKHILAAILGKQVPSLFGSGVNLRSVIPEEAAGWAGGWGE
jgi:hypothetical protein